ncbi:hypothetical protein IG631_16541 [Alternaria alternata]|nr:hypothetical protein IG631_16541 [Alternaria alternata]
MAFLQSAMLEEASWLESLGFYLQDFPSSEESEEPEQSPLDYVLDQADPWKYSNDDPKASLMFYKEALYKWIFKNDNLSLADRGKRMVRVSKRIGDSLPEVHHLTIECDHTPLSDNTMRPSTWIPRVV